MKRTEDLYRVHVRFKTPQNDRPSNLGRRTELRRFTRYGDARWWALKMKGEGHEVTFEHAEALWTAVQYWEGTS